jgi:hypothetical protein
MTDKLLHKKIYEQQRQRERTARTRGGWVEILVAERARTSDELRNELDALISDRADRGHEVAAVIHDEFGRWVLFFRPQPRVGPSHVTATVVDRDVYSR